MTTRNNLKERIVDYLFSRKLEPTTAKDIQEALKISYPTLTKWLAVLEAEGKILVNDYGNIKFYYHYAVKNG